MKSLRLLLISFGVIGIISFIGYRLFLNVENKKASQKSPPVVTVATVIQEKYQPTIEAIGTLQANQGAILKAQTSGQVEKINVIAGETVQQNDILVELNNDQQKAALDAAITQEELNKTTYQRDVELKKLGAISLASVDQAKAAVDSGDAAVQEAKANYELTLTKAPFSGRVGISKVNVGDYLQAGDAIVSLQNLDPMFVNFYVPQKYFSNIKIGAQVTIHADTVNTSMIGHVISYETVIDENTGMIQVRASVPNSSQQLLPGGYVRISMDSALPVEALVVPQMSVMYEEKGAYVYLVKNNVAYKTTVTVGPQIEQTIQILFGLKAGDQVISAGTNKVSDGKTVQIDVSSSEESA